jgi:transcription elongation GreA/GreB family factor
LAVVEEEAALGKELPEDQAAAVLMSMLEEQAQQVKDLLAVLELLRQTMVQEVGVVPGQWVVMVLLLLAGVAV